jgi:hypothetical protein
MEPSSLRWDSNVWLRVLRDFGHWHIALQITDPSSRQRGRPKRRAKQLSGKKKKNEKEKKNLVMGPKGVPDTKTNRRLTVGYNISTKLNSKDIPRVEAGKNTPTVIPASRKRRRKGNPVISDLRVMYDYESSATLTTDRLHYKLQTRPLVREGRILPP